MFERYRSTIFAGLSGHKMKSLFYFRHWPNELITFSNWCKIIHACGKSPTKGLSLFRFSAGTFGHFSLQVISCTPLGKKQRITQSNTRSNKYAPTHLPTAHKCTFRRPLTQDAQSLAKSGTYQLEADCYQVPHQQNKESKPMEETKGRSS